MKERKTIDYYVLKVRDSHSVVFKIFRLFLKMIFFLSKLIPGLNKSLSSIEIINKISNLENQGEYGLARTIRSKALTDLPPMYLGPLWRSEGEDRLYQIKDYKGALDAFEKSIAVMNKAGMFGITAPDKVYYGAALSCILLGEKKKAEKYFILFEELVAKLTENSDLNWEWQLNGIKYLKNRIYKTATNKSIESD